MEITPEFLKACARLESEGRALSVRSVREAMGGKGSFSTIAPMLKFYQEMKVRDPFSLSRFEGMPDELKMLIMKLVGEVWEAARREGYEAGLREGKQGEAAGEEGT